MPALSATELLMLCLVTAAGVYDLAIRKIPNKLLAAAWLAGAALLAGAASPGVAAMSALAGAALCFTLYLPFYVMRGMAAGDVKLIATLGFLAGAPEGIRIAVLSWCFGGAMGIVIMLFNGTLRRGLSNLCHLLRPVFMRAAGMPAVSEPLEGSAGNMPYGLAIALGTFTVLWLRHS